MINSRGAGSAESGRGGAGGLGFLHPRLHRCEWRFGIWTLTRRSTTSVGLSLSGRCHGHAAKKKIRGPSATLGMTQKSERCSCHSERKLLKRRIPDTGSFGFAQDGTKNRATTRTVANSCGEGELITLSPWGGAGCARRSCSSAPARCRPRSSATPSTVSGASSHPRAPAACGPRAARTRRAAG